MRLPRLLAGRRRARPVDFREVGISVEAALAAVDPQPEVAQSESIQVRYSFDPSWERERERVSHIETWLDPHSIRAFEALGVASGWRCLDAGARGGSLTQWLCDRVGPQGSVVALDADTRFVDKLGAPNLEVWRADVEREELPEACFDLVHTRLLLQHLPDRERVLEKLARAVKPGGWLLVFESGGMPPTALQQAEVFDRFSFAMLDSATSTGWALQWAPSLPQRIAQLGMEEVRALAFRDYVNGSEHGFPAFIALSVAQLRDRLLATGRVDAAHLDAVVAALRDPAAAFLTFECWVVSARRPAA